MDVSSFADSEDETEDSRAVVIGNGGSTVGRKPDIYFLLPQLIVGQEIVVGQTECVF